MQRAMARFVLHLSVAIVTLGFGLATNVLVNQLVDQYVNSSLPDLETPVASRWYAFGLEPCDDHKPVVVSIDVDRKVYLGRFQAGSLDDTSLLRNRLTNSSQWLLQHCVSGGDLNSTTESECSSVYIKVPRFVSFNDLSDLLDAIKVTGADRVVVITDFQKGDYSRYPHPSVRVLRLQYAPLRIVANE
jgi:biopolymer transport protein ExbD